MDGESNIDDVVLSLRPYESITISVLGSDNSMLFRAVKVVGKNILQHDRVVPQLKLRACCHDFAAVLNDLLEQCRKAASSTEG